MRQAIVNTCALLAGLAIVITAWAEHTRAELCEKRENAIVAVSPK